MRLEKQSYSNTFLEVFFWPVHILRHYKKGRRMDDYLKKLVPFIVAGLLCLCACADNNNGDCCRVSNQEKAQGAVDSVRLALETQLGNPVPSLNVIIQTPKEVIFVSSAAIVGERITRDTYFRFASNTKNFTASAILNMYEDGWLDYEANIVDAIPGSDMPYVPTSSEWDIPYKNDITIEQLLQHSAGVYDVDNDEVPGCDGDSYTSYQLSLDPNHQFTATELVEQVTLNNLYYFEPGTDHHYSNTGYTILGEIVARVYSFHSGGTKTLSDYLDDYIVGGLSPVRLDVHFPYLASDISVPTPNQYGTIYYPDETETYLEYNMSAQVAEGNGYGTLSQMNEYIRTLMKGENCLEPETVTLMQTDASPGDDRYSLGCDYRENLGYGHNGARLGNLALMTYDPDFDVSMAVYLPLWDLTRDTESFMDCYWAMYDAAYAVRAALGYPGDPFQQT